MANSYISSFDHIRELFPELTDTQFQIVLLFSTGIPLNNISELKSVSPTFVKRTLNVVKDCFGADTIDHVRSVVQIRINLTMLKTIDKLISH